MIPKNGRFYLNKLDQYIKLKKMTISDVARQTGLSRPLIHYALNGQPLGKRSALKIEEWSEGFVPAIELIRLYDKKQ